MGEGRSGWYLTDCGVLGICLAHPILRNLILSLLRRNYGKPQNLGKTANHSVAQGRLEKGKGRWYQRILGGVIECLSTTSLVMIVEN